MEIILASKSKRRIEMMDELGYPYRAVESGATEVVDPSLSDEEIVKKLSKIKAMDVYKDNKDALILGFDTLVFFNGKPIGKPKDKNECINIIKSLSGNTHKVITGGFLKYKEKEISFSSSCLVTFDNIPDSVIVKYAETTEPYDKAGGYAVQGFIGRYISKVDGDIFTVIGMPKSIVNKLLFEFIQNN